MSAIDAAVNRHMDWLRKPKAPPAGPSQLDRIERKLDILIAALAGEDEGEPERSLDDGRPISARDNRRGLG